MYDFIYADAVYQEGERVYRQERLARLRTIEPLFRVKRADRRSERDKALFAYYVKVAEAFVKARRELELDEYLGFVYQGTHEAEIRKLRERENFYWSKASGYSAEKKRARK